MNPLDFVVLIGTMLGIAAYGIWRTRGHRNLSDYLKGDKTERLGDHRHFGHGHAGQRHHVHFHARPGL